MHHKILNYKPQEHFPIKFDLYNRNMPAWNYRWIEENPTERLTKISSLIESNLQQHEFLINFRGIQTHNHPEFISTCARLKIPTIQSQSFSCNLFASLTTTDALTFKNHSYEDELHKIMDAIGAPSTWITPECMYATIIKAPNFKHASPAHKAVLNRFLEEVMPGHDRIRTMAAFFKELGLMSESQEDITDRIELFYKQNTDHSFSNFKHFSQTVNPIFYKELQVLEKTNLKHIFLNEQAALYTGSNFLVADHPDGLINEFIVAAYLNQTVNEFSTANVEYHKRLFLFDERFFIKNEVITESFVNFLRKTRSCGIASITATSFYPQNLPGVWQPVLASELCNCQAQLLGNFTHGAAAWLQDHNMQNLNINFSALKNEMLGYADPDCFLW